MTVAVVTGGARGIGLATAKALAAGGAKVAIGDLEADAVDAVASTNGLLGAPLDVADEDSFAAFLSVVERELGAVDVLVNNAGIMPIGPFVAETGRTERRVLEVNVLGCLTGMRLVLPGMLQRGSGHVVNLASVAGRAPSVGGLTYAASKAAVVHATETARVEHAGRGVSFTCVVPSFTNTDLISGTKGTKFVKTVEAEDVAAAIVTAIEKKTPDVYVPRSIGPILAVQRLVGRRLRDAMNHAIGADSTFLDVDAAARAAYEQRIGT